MTEVFTNLARSTLASGILSTDLSLTVQSGDGSSLFPVLGGSDNFRCLLFKKSTGDIEIINVTARTADVFTIARAQESIGNIAANAFDFDAGDIIEHRPTSAFLTALASGASSTNIQHGTFLYAVDTGAANAYVVTMNPTAVTIVAGQEVRVKITNTNTGIAATLKLDGITATPITMEGGGNPPAGTIKAGFVHTFIYDGTSFIFQSQGLALTSAGFNALGKQIKNVAAGTASNDAATIGLTETLALKTLTSPIINGATIDTTSVGATQSPGNNSTKLATTAYTDEATGLVKSRGGVVASAGSLTAQSGGFSVNKTSTGLYTISHTLGSNAYAVACSAVIRDHYITVSSTQSTFFTIQVRLRSTDGLADGGFDFVISNW